MSIFDLLIGQEFGEQDLPISPAADHIPLILLHLVLQSSIQKDHFFDLPLHLLALCFVIMLSTATGHGHRYTCSGAADEVRASNGKWAAHHAMGITRQREAAVGAHFLLEAVKSSSRLRFAFSSPHDRRPPDFD
jgi:hypothetical protein